MVQINGKRIPLPDNVSLADYLQQEGYQVNLIAVERNGAIVPRGKYATTLLKEDDTLEIVSFVGGG